VKVLVTGHRGYIGVHLVDLLKSAGHAVTGCDLGLFDGCEWEAYAPADRELIQDVRALEAADLEGHDCVMHLAALSNDPMGNLDERITQSVNCEGSVRLARLAKQAGVERFLFSGSCSVYGKGEKLDLDESDPLNPLTAYARSKIDSEQAIGALAGDGFTPVFLRNATAYGDSPMLRIDLVVNNLLACAAAMGEICIHSDGTPWRPLIHCRDIARAFAAFMEAPADTVRAEAVNVGANEENFQVRDIAARVQELMPSARITYTGEVGNDPRSYRVRFDRLRRLLPAFRLQYTLSSGMDELHRKLIDRKFSVADFKGPQFVRLRTLAGRMDRLNRELEVASAAGA
jgi:nucleoside-diphosphate-sugar epimerase